MNILISYLSNKILGQKPTLSDKWRVLQIISIFFNVELKRYAYYNFSLSSMLNFLSAFLCRHIFYHFVFFQHSQNRNDLSPFQNLLLTIISASQKEMEVESHSALTPAMVKESAEALLNRWHNKK